MRCEDVVVGRVAKAELTLAVLPPTLHAVVAQESACCSVANSHTQRGETGSNVDGGRFPNTTRSGVPKTELSVIVGPPTQQFTVVEHGTGMGIGRPSLGSRIIDAQGRDGATVAKVDVLGCFFSAAGVAEAKLSVVVPSPAVERAVVVDGA